MNQANAILGLLAQTSIHAGTGQNTGVIDLPIQREGHSGYPCVFGSAMKGALRSHSEAIYGKDADEVTRNFGPSSTAEDASEYAGALLISDARILLLPVRSLTSQFKWVTCPAVLSRYLQDAKRFGLDSTAFDIPVIPTVKEESEATAIISNQSSERHIFLEEYRFNARATDLSTVIEALAKIMHGTADIKANLEQQLVIVSNNMFSHICQHATPVNAHIAIDSTTKVVRPGALWYEETLPPESLLYVGITANKSRKKNDDFSADKILSNLTSLFIEGSPWLQIGGNETVGMGWCAVKIQKSQQEG